MPAFTKSSVDPAVRARGAARWLAAGLSGALGLPERHARARRTDGRWGILLAYHRVIPPEEPASYYRMGLDARLFREQVSWLAERYRVVALEEFLWWKASGRTPDRDLVVLTFDDGYADNGTHAAPVLLSLRLPATFYITSGLSLRQQPYWPEVIARMIRSTRVHHLTVPLGKAPISLPLRTDRERSAACGELIARLKTMPAAAVEEALVRVRLALAIDREQAGGSIPRLLTVEEIRALAAAGFTIGSHTVSHPYLPAEDPGRRKAEIEGSRRQLEEMIGGPVVDFCYPVGGYDAATREMVAAAGYRSAVTTDHGVAGARDDVHLLPRIAVSEPLALSPAGRFSSGMMRAEISGLFAGVHRL